MTPEHAYHAGLFIGWLLKHEDVTIQPQHDDNGEVTDEVVVSHFSGAHWHIRVLEPDFIRPEEN